MIHRTMQEEERRNIVNPPAPAILQKSSFSLDRQLNHHGVKSLISSIWHCRFSLSLVLLSIPSIIAFQKPWLLNDGAPFLSRNDRISPFSSAMLSFASKNLWTIDECMEQYDQQHQQQQQQHSETGRLVFIDASWYHKGNRNGRHEFEEGPRLPGAQYWDMDDLATSKRLFPELNPDNCRVMFPPKSLIAATLKTWNITADDRIVVYGRQGALFTPRLWYILKTFGHTKVGLLQGSLEDWQTQGGPVDMDPMIQGYDFWAKDLLSSQLYKDCYAMYSSMGSDRLDRILTKEEVLNGLALEGSSFLLFDTRGPTNFAKGHIPGAVSVPYRLFVNPDNPLEFKNQAAIQEILDPLLLQSGIQDDEETYKDTHNTRTIWLSCGSGVSVCHLALALDECGYLIDSDDDTTAERMDLSRNQKSKSSVSFARPFIYDGSWNEWGADPDTPKESEEV